jgi:uncharacterized protein (DUF1330 family)
MAGYAVAHLKSVRMGPDIAAYLRAIDATLAPFRGKFVVHGAQPEVREGEWPGHLIVIEFPTLDAARAWYDSPAYRAVLPLRTKNSEGDVILVDGVEPGHRATDILPPAALA